jgi:hypothetical protein
MSVLWRGVTYIIRLGWLWAPLFWCVTYVYSRCDMIEWIILLYSQWMVWSKAKPYFSMKSRYIDIEGVLNFMQLKVQRVFLSYKVVTLSSEYLIFYHQHNARQLSNRSIFHAGRYLDDKEICYHTTVIVTANVCYRPRGVWGYKYWSHISSKI